MKLRNFDNFLLQEAESESHAEAAKLGLVYKGFGYYTDPRTGQITHQAVDGKLVPYSKPSDQPIANPSGDPDSLKDKNVQGDPTGPQMAPGTGIAGAPEPGTEQYPRGANWNPGPNGDHCVGDQEPPKDLAYDTFVGKTNYYKWTAGKEGSNYKNIKVQSLLNEPPARREHKEHSFFSFLSEGPMAPTEQGNPTPGGLGGQTPSEKARQMGLKSDGHGSWRDSQGNIVARTVNGELVFYEPGGGAVSDSGGGSDLAMAKPTWTDPTSGMAMTPPAQPETPEEIAAVPAATPAQAPADYEKFMNRKKIDQYNNAKVQGEIDQAQQEVDQKYGQNPVLKAIQLQCNQFINDAQESGDVEEITVANHLMDVLVDKADQFTNLMSGIPPDAQPGLANELTRVAEREARLRMLEGDDNNPETFEEAQDDVEQKLANDSRREQVVNDQQSSLESLQKEFDLNMEEELSNLEGRKKSNREKMYEKFREELSNIPDEASQASFIQAVNHANTYIGRPNTGKGKNAMGFADIQTLKANRGRLVAGYADGDYEQVEQFVRSARPLEVSDSFAEASYNVLPESFKRSLKGKGNVSGTYKGHFLGYKEDGTDKRGGTGNDDRGKLMWKIILEQGGKDAYTGLPLDLNSMDLEHVVGFNNNDYGKPTKEDKEAREHERNMVMINTNINQKKSDMNMNQFFESQVDPLEDWTEDQYNRRDAKYDEQNRIIDTKEQLAAMLIKNGDLDEKMTGDVLMQYFENEEQENKAFNKSLSVGKKNNKELAEIDALKSAFGKKLFQAAGFSTGLTKPTTGRGTVSIKEDSYYRGMMVSYASLDKKGRQHFKDVYNNAFSAANVAGRQAAETGEKLTQVDQRQMIVDALNNSGLIDSRVHDNKNMQKIWGKGNQSFDKMFKSQAPDGGAGKFTMSMDDMVKKARSSGDETRMAIADNVESGLKANESKYKEYYDMVPEEAHKELDTLFKEDLILKSKVKQALSKLPKDYDRRQIIDSLMDQGFSVPYAYDAADGKLEEFPEFRAKLRTVENSGKPYEYKTEPEPNEFIKSDNLQYQLQSGEASPEEIDAANLALVDKHFDYFKRTGLKSPSRSVEVAWDTYDNVPEDKRNKVAMEALKTWRKEILPKLEPGTIVTNVPKEGGRGDDARERLYSLAGFGDYDEDLEQQMGLVIIDEKGKKKVIPIGETKKRDKRRKSLQLEDYYIGLLDFELNSHGEEVVEFMLFT